ncbi:hypothetical protein OESDEN_13523 [Oesophagostomum dentatum]|uniref:Uncharacterized protein n=1 Tax=Oesophagostomum dentatum TaxID=61180 RepID=A0A0B1SN29_OESDE|nr:hypothetical protein OESDEN_13523 [Oesophagostomum dentatum]
MQYYNKERAHVFLCNTNGDCLPVSKLAEFSDPAELKVTTLPPTVGWERTHEGKMTPQFADMRKQFDPKK